MTEYNGELRGRQSEENFLKTILILQRRHGVATPSDLEAELQYKTSAVYNFVNKLEREGYVIANRGTRGKKPSIEFTEKGRVVAERMFQRHQQIQDWLMLLGTPETEAEAEACLFEHGLSETTMGIISRHVEMAKANFGGAPYPEKMRQMGQAMEHMRAQKTGMTETDKMVDAVTNHGGYETLIEQSQVLDELGGEKLLRERLQEIESLGGIKGIRARDKQLEKMGGFKDLQRMIDSIEFFGGIEQLTALQEATVALGGIKRMKQALALHESYGYFKKMKEKNDTLNALEKLGGLREVNRKLNALEALGGLESVAKLNKKLDKIHKLSGSNE